ncbi:MAG: hypothetical protein LBE83_02915 [Propionibacteriaceae bacterium]|nr:hypothetical protein [Propionibacteriaceae bacterium]
MIEQLARRVVEEASWRGVQVTSSVGTGDAAQPGNPDRLDLVAGENVVTLWPHGENTVRVRACVRSRWDFIRVTTVDADWPVNWSTIDGLATLLAGQSRRVYPWCGGQRLVVGRGSTRRALKEVAMSGEEWVSAMFAEVVKRLTKAAVARGIELTWSRGTEPAFGEDDFPYLYVSAGVNTVTFSFVNEYEIWISARVVVEPSRSRVLAETEEGWMCDIVFVHCVSLLAGDFRVEHPQSGPDLLVVGEGSDRLSLVIVEPPMTGESGV